MADDSNSAENNIITRSSDWKKAKSIQIEINLEKSRFGKMLVKKKN